MKKFIIIAAISMAALVGCSSQTQPIPTVTVTQQAPSPSTDDGNIVNSRTEFINFVRENGGLYGSVATDGDILDLGNTICNARADGLSEDEILYTLSAALVQNSMNNDDGAKFGAALIFGSENYLCGVNTF